jgi:hypothetical protein
MRVVWNLDRLDTAGSHHLGELAEGGRRVVRGADLDHAAVLAQRLEERQVVAPRQEVVHLVEVHPAAVERERALHLRASLGRGAGPHLCGHESVVAAAGERGRQHVLRGSVHRRGVEQRGASAERGVQHAA